MDANMHLACKYVSSDAQDPGLGTGMAYVVAEGPYQEHLEKYSDQIEVSCA